MKKVLIACSLIKKAEVLGACIDKNRCIFSDFIVVKGLQTIY